jgi:hypothetical protein
MQLAVAIQGVEKRTVEGRPPTIPGPTLAGPVLGGDSTVSAAGATRPAPALLSPGGDRPRPLPSLPQRQALPELLPVEEDAIPQTDQPIQAQPDQTPEPQTPAPPVPLELPSLVQGDWAQAARRFLAVLEALDKDTSDGESLWARLGLWGMTATTALVLFELGRQQLRKQREADIDLALAHALDIREPLWR